MTRIPSHHSRVESANSLDAMAAHYKRQGFIERGYKDGTEDPQPCELPPPELKTQEQIDLWTEGYRKAWAKRKEAAK